MTRFTAVCTTLAVAVVVITAGCAKTVNSAATNPETMNGFSGGRAYQMLKRQCAFGPRYPGVKAHEATADFITSELKPLADEVTVDKFKCKALGKELDLQNIYAVFNPDASRFILLCAHWDTRPVADQEVAPAKQDKPILGANDGASGVAVLLELARIFHEKKPDVGVVMAFFDGEDYGPGNKDMFLGSTEFAKRWKVAVKPKGREIKYDYGILLDMIGDKNLAIPREGLSQEKATAVVDKVWAAAAAAGYGNIFTDNVPYAISDDHKPLLDAGIKCIDIIDFDYAYWHTLEDTADKCSPKSLQIVGNVISTVVYGERSTGSK